MDAAIVSGLRDWAAARWWLSSLVVDVAQYGVAINVLAIAIAWFLRGEGQAQRRQMVAAGSLAFFLGLVAVYVMGLFIYRERPFIAHDITPLFAHADDSSFPSDHALLGFALVAPIAFRYWRTMGWLGVWAILVGVARVASGVHYLSDILGSALIGGVLAYGSAVLVLHLPLQRWDLQELTSYARRLIRAR